MPVDPLNTNSSNTSHYSLSEALEAGGGQKVTANDFLDDLIPGQELQQTIYKSFKLDTIGTSAFFSASAALTLLFTQETNSLNASYQQDSTIYNSTQTLNTNQNTNTTALNTASSTVSADASVIQQDYPAYQTAVDNLNSQAQAGFTGTTQAAAISAFNSNPDVLAYQTALAQYNTDLPSYNLALSTYESGVTSYNTGIVSTNNQAASRAGVTPVNSSLSVLAYNNAVDQTNAQIRALNLNPQPQLLNYQVIPPTATTISSTSSNVTLTGTVTFPITPNTFTPSQIGTGSQVSNSSAPPSATQYQVSLGNFSQSIAQSSTLGSTLSNDDTKRLESLILQLTGNPSLPKAYKSDTKANESTSTVSAGGAGSGAGGIMAAIGLGNPETASIISSTLIQNGLVQAGEDQSLTNNLAGNLSAFAEILGAHSRNTALLNSVAAVGTGNLEQTSPTTPLGNLASTVGLINTVTQLFQNESAGPQGQAPEAEPASANLENTETVSPGRAIRGNFLLGAKSSKDANAPAGTNASPSANTAAPTSRSTQPNRAAKPNTSSTASTPSKSSGTSYVPNNPSGAPSVSTKSSGAPSVPPKSSGTSSVPAKSSGISPVSTKIAAPSTNTPIAVTSSSAASSPATSSGTSATPAKTTAAPSLPTSPAVQHIASLLQNAASIFGAEPLPQAVSNGLANNVSLSLVNAAAEKFGEVTGPQFAPAAAFTATTLANQPNFTTLLNTLSPYNLPILNANPVSPSINPVVATAFSQSGINLSQTYATPSDLSLAALKLTLSQSSVVQSLLNDSSQTQQASQFISSVQNAQSAADLKAVVSDDNNQAILNKLRGHFASSLLTLTFAPSLANTISSTITSGGHAAASVTNSFLDSILPNVYGFTRGSVPSPTSFIAVLTQLHTEAKHTDAENYHNLKLESTRNYIEMPLTSLSHTLTQNIMSPAHFMALWGLMYQGASGSKFTQNTTQIPV